MRKLLLLTMTHLLFAAAGFAVGIYVLPILTAPGSPGEAEMEAAIDEAQYQAMLRRDLEGSDFLHWGEGTVSVGKDFISLQGKLAPGPDYRLYLSPEFVQTEAEFARVKSTAVHVGDIRTFDNFIVPVPETVDIHSYNTVVVWCESFGEFISAARYRER